MGNSIRKQSKQVRRLEEKARHHVNAATENYNSNNLSTALEHYSKALAIREQLAPESLAVATSYNNIGTVLRDQGNLTEALEHYSKALAIKEQLAPGSLAVATSYNNIGTVLSDQGNLAEALEHYTKALAIEEQLAPGSLTVATSYNNIGTVLSDQGNLTEALVKFDKCLQFIKQQSLPVLSSHPLLLRCQYIIAKLHLSAGEFELALQFADEILDNLNDYKWAHLLKGQVLHKLGCLEEAVKVLEEASFQYPNFSDLQLAALEVKSALLAERPTLGDQEKEDLMETVMQTLEADPSHPDPSDVLLNKRLQESQLQSVSGVLLTDKENASIQQLLPSSEVTSREEQFAKVESLIHTNETLKATVEEMKEVVKQLVLGQNQLRNQLSAQDKRLIRLEDEIISIKATTQDLISNCVGNNDQAIAKRKRLLEINEDENLRDYFEALLTETKSMIVFCNAVYGGRFETNATLPGNYKLASQFVMLLSMVPIPGADVASKILSSVILLRARMIQLVKFEDVANVTSSLEAHGGRERFDEMVVLLCLEQVLRVKGNVQNLPRWDSEAGKKFREDFVSLWRDILKNIPKSATPVISRIQDTGKRIARAVGLSKSSDGFVRQRPNAHTHDGFFSTQCQKNVGVLWSQGTKFLFGGMIRWKALKYRLINGKPLSHAVVLAKLHARALVQLITDPDAVHDLIKMNVSGEKGWEHCALDVLIPMMEKDGLEGVKMPGLSSDDDLGSIFKDAMKETNNE